MVILETSKNMGRVIFFSKMGPNMSENSKRDKSQAMAATMLMTSQYPQATGLKENLRILLISVQSKAKKESKREKVKDSLVPREKVAGRLKKKTLPTGRFKRNFGLQIVHRKIS